MTVVRFLSTPVETLIELQSAIDDLQREVHVIALDAGADPVAPDVVVGMVDERARLAALRTDMHRQATTARTEGRRRVDIVVDYPEGSRATVEAVTHATEAADEAAADGRLLCPPLADDLRRLWSWMVAEHRNQVDGGPATPFRAE